MQVHVIGTNQSINQSINQLTTVLVNERTNERMGTKVEVEVRRGLQTQTRQGEYGGLLYFTFM